MKLLYLDTSYNSSKFRSEFRIPANVLVYSDMEILNVGLSKTDNGNTIYNSFGALNIIKSIEIYDGSTLLDQIQQFDIYQSWKTVSKSNADNASINRGEKGADFGFFNLDAPEYAATGVLNANEKIGAFMPDYTDNVYGADATAQKRKSNGKVLNLADFMGICEGMAYFPPNVFKDLRVVINYNSDVLDNVRDRTGTYETLEPFMSVRYEENEERAEQLMKDFSGAVFDTVEHASVILDAQDPGNDTTTVQTQNYFIKSFNDKYITEVVCINTPNNSATYTAGNNTDRYSKYGSVAQCEFEIQNRYNGVIQFPNGLRGKNRSLGVMVDTVGSYDMATGQNLTSLQGGTADYYNDRLSGGLLCYNGWKVDDLVKEWKMTVSRRAIGGSAAAPAGNLILRQGLTLNMFGKSRKSITPVNGGYVVQYV